MKYIKKYNENINLEWEFDEEEDELEGIYYLIRSDRSWDKKIVNI